MVEEEKTTKKSDKPNQDTAVADKPRKQKKFPESFPKLYEVKRGGL